MSNRRVGATLNQLGPGSTETAAAAAGLASLAVGTLSSGIVVVNAQLRKMIARSLPAREVQRK